MSNPYSQPPPEVLVIEAEAPKGNFTPCGYCGCNTNSHPRKKVGAAAIVWALICFCSTVLLFWIPLCNDNCKDTDICCSRCMEVKTTIPTDIC